MVVSALLTTPYPLKIGWSQLKKQETLYPEKKVFLAIKHDNLPAVVLISHFRGILIVLFRRINYNEE